MCLHWLGSHIWHNDINTSTRRNNFLLLMLSKLCLHCPGSHNFFRSSLSITPLCMPNKRTLPKIGIGTESDFDCGDLEVFHRPRFGLPISITIFPTRPVWVSSDAGNLTTDLFIYLEALIKQYITNIEQKNKKRDVFDKGLANGRGVPTRQTPYILLYTKLIRRRVQI